MSPIPPKIRKQLENDKFMKSCIVCGSQQVQWHHAFFYQQRQIQETWAIVPLCPIDHRDISKHSDYARYRALQRATDEELKKYPRIEWRQLKSFLNNKFFKV